MEEGGETLELLDISKEDSCVRKSGTKVFTVEALSPANLISTIELKVLTQSPCEVVSVTR